MRRLDKAEMRQRGRELRELLVGWDPIGSVTGGGPRDEYDCVLWPLMRMLEDDASSAELSAFLAGELRDHFGLSSPESCAPHDFAVRAKAWFQAGWRGTRVHPPDRAE